MWNTMSKSIVDMFILMNMRIRDIPLDYLEYKSINNRFIDNMKYESYMCREVCSIFKYTTIMKFLKPFSYSYAV